LRKNDRPIEIEKDLKNHQVHIKKSDGLYTHYRCRQQDLWCYGFDIITWPGSFCITGDMGTYIFQRTENMMDFMTSACRSPSYAKEKCVAYSSPLEVFSFQLFEKDLKERLKNCKEYDNSQANVFEEEIENIIHEIKANSREQDESFCIELLYDSLIYSTYDGDSLDYRELDWVFLWNLEAIQWFLSNKDKVNTSIPKKPTQETFKQHLNEASKIVATWPEWKRNILGGTKMNLENATIVSYCIDNKPNAIYAVFDKTSEFVKTILVGNITDFHCYLDLGLDNKLIAIEIKTREDELSFDENNKDKYIQIAYSLALEAQKNINMNSQQLLSEYKKYENSIMQQ
jgi:hypothetical protein